MRHIVLIGFKGVGKSTVGKALAKHLDLAYVDTDRAIEDLYETKKRKRLSCREIMRLEGHDFFRELEREALEKVLSANEQTIVAVGGGAPLLAQNQAILAGHTLVHLTAHKGSVFERIMLNGVPAFFPKDMDPYLAFKQIWIEREPVYQKLATLTMDNSGDLDLTVKNLAAALPNDAEEKIVLLIHGPNLNKLGSRDAKHYGNITLPMLEEVVEAESIKLGITVVAFQSNHEGALIDFIQQNSGIAHGIIINPGALTHYSYALHDALVDSNLPAVEVHLSDIKNREGFRQISVTAPACVAQISGKLEAGYIEALNLLKKKLV